MALRRVKQLDALRRWALCPILLAKIYTCLTLCSLLPSSPCVLQLRPWLRPRVSWGVYNSSLV